MEDFQKHKLAVLEGVDLSRKGSVDAGIKHIVELINNHHAYVTTSSCSGRIAVVEQELKGQVVKKGCTWLYITHDAVSSENVEEAVCKCVGNSVFKFEGFVLHVQCKTLPHAQAMLAEAVAAGFRNSGMTISKKDRITVAVRSTHSLEAPLTQQGKVLVSTEYIIHLVNLANTKLEENIRRIGRLFEGLQRCFAAFEEVSDVGCKGKYSKQSKLKTMDQKETKGNGIMIEKTVTDSKKEEDYMETFSDVCDMFISDG